MFENTPFCPYISPSHPSLPSFSYCECEEYKDRQDKLFEKVESISKAIEEFKSKRCVIPSKKVREPHTPTMLVRRKKKAIRDVLSARKSKEIVIPPSSKAIEEFKSKRCVIPSKKVRESHTPTRSVRRKK